MLAAGPPLRGRPRRAPSGVRIQMLGRWLQLIRARRGGGKPGIRLCPAARPRRGMVSPNPAQRAPEPTSNRGADRQPRALAQPRDKQLAPRSRRPASAAQSTLQAVLRGDTAPRPRPPPFRPLGPPPRLLQKDARARRGVPGRLDGSSQPRTAPTDPAASHAASRTLFFWGGGVAALDLVASILRGPVANPREREERM
ncbi:PREDICTED: translation initiation factor IF-2-like [Miniopterus natalensis]|uniref:translation initiation factor IF-2-like n=1 Tax=Miniopterus natalensis TaxID=291302 RepID=UPI0007A718C9|nr:PREDICTED: translation initiation factor IF-2-like [Miniopterus natalensis]